MNTQQMTDIINGRASKLEGYRQVAFTMQGEILPVISANWKGIPTAKHTRQCAENGDLVLRVEWNRSPTIWKLYLVEGGELTYLPDGLNKYKSVLGKLPKDLDAWLASSERNIPSMLPAGIGWDGVYTVNSRKKVDSIRKLFQGLEGVVFNHPTEGEINWLDELCRQALVSSFRGLNTNSIDTTNPDTLMPLPYEDDPSTPDSFYQWVTWSEGKPPTIFTFSEIESTWQTARVGDSDTKIAIITWNAYKSSKDTYGVCWSIYDVAK